MDASLLKKDIRIRHLQRRATFSDEEYLQRSHTICEHLRSLTKDWELHYVHVFLPIIGRKEPDIYSFIQHLIRVGVTVVVPIAQVHTREMKHAIIDQYTEFDVGAWGEPVPKKPQYVTRNHYDLLLVPMLAVDHDGYRLGYGKGYYDAFLKIVSGTTIGVCYDDECVEHLPIEVHDQPVSFIVTEHNTIPMHNSF
jgi:5-formyltetrahydrofolate cyclo-ligase